MKLRKVPNTFVIIFFIILLAAIITWIVPGGTYERTTVTVNNIEREGIVDGSFRETDNSPQTWQVFSSFFKGFERQAGIIVFVLMIGGAFWIVNSTRSIDAGIFSFLRYTRRLEHKKFIKWLGVDNIIIVLIMLLFSSFGAIFGMSEETIPFIIIGVPLAISMGYDSILGVCLVFVGAGLGFAGAVLNPFTIGIAQGLSDIPLYSGIEYRLFCWLVINTVGIIYVLRYAHKIRKNPEKSPVYKEDEVWRKRQEDDTEEISYHTLKSAWITYGFISIVLFIYSLLFFQTEMKIGNQSVTFPALPVLAGVFVLLGIFSLRKSVHFFILQLFGFTMLFLIVGVMGYEWEIMHIATLFLALGLASGITMGYNGDKIVKLFMDGVKDILSAAIIVGLAGGIIIILEDGNVVDTILHSLAQSMKDMSKTASIGIMYLIQTAINIIIPSASAKAALTMPIMAPFSDIIGISRQATVLAYQFGDGFTNMITPTSGVLIAVLGVAKIPYEKWVKWVIPFMIILVILAYILLIPTVTMKLSGF